MAEPPRYVPGRELRFRKTQASKRYRAPSVIYEPQNEQGFVASEHLPGHIPRATDRAHTHSISRLRRKKGRGKPIRHRIEYRSILFVVHGDKPRKWCQWLVCWTQDSDDIPGIRTVELSNDFDLVNVWLQPDQPAQSEQLPERRWIAEDWTVPKQRGGRRRFARLYVGQSCRHHPCDAVGVTCRARGQLGLGLSG